MAELHAERGLVELTHTSDLDPALSNEDLLPTPFAERSWNLWHIASLWVGMAVCVPTYMLASSMIVGGLSWKEALMMILLGNLIVAVPMVFNGHAGTKFGIPFPVLGRASFGYNGIHIPSLLRAIVACGWFGIQTWLGGLAMVAILAVIVGKPAWNQSWNAQFIGFMVFWAIQMFFVWKGTESIKWLETLAAPLLIIMGLGMLYWGISNGGGLGKVLSSSYEFNETSVAFVQDKGGSTFAQLRLLKGKDGKVRAKAYRAKLLTQEALGKDWQADLKKAAFVPFSGARLSFSAAQSKGAVSLGIQFQGTDKKHISSVLTIPVAKALPAKRTSTPISSYLFWLTAMVAFWATLALNIPDITRYATSQKDQIAGQFLGLPTTMVLYSFIGVAVTCAAILIFDDILIATDAPWDPVRLLARLEDKPALLILSQFAILLATLSTNIAANVISPANSFANLWPQKISFRTGGILAGILGIVIMPWKLLGVIVGFLLTYGAMLGPVIAILLADYFFLRKKELALDELYKKDGRYAYVAGFNPSALISLFLGICLVLVGLWVPSLKILYDTGWFTGFFFSFVTYLLLMKILHKPQQA
ncbi:MAG: NCS1 family nucleobase:cation symporter-1 [Myxococcales bacterium]|nr:NCS1 family nucleobase:cation symporter-1 [Myxococcales bacterium]MCB9643616.1 NCS1 family nucleobase:cation symporter-1 [Myxococcales bacterium]